MSRGCFFRDLADQPVRLLIFLEALVLGDPAVGAPVVFQEIEAPFDEPFDILLFVLVGGDMAGAGRRAGRGIDPRLEPFGVDDSPSRPSCPGKRGLELILPCLSRGSPWSVGSLRPGFTAQQSSMLTYI